VISRTRDITAACVEWVAVAGLVAGAAAVLTSNPTPTGAPSGRTDQRPGDDRGEPAGPLDDVSVAIEDPVVAEDRSTPGSVPVWARNGFVPGARGVLLGPVRGQLLLSELALTATAPRGVTEPVELYVELTPGTTTAGCLAAQTEPATTRIAALAGTRTDPAHASATWPVPQRLGATADGSWCLVVEVLRSGLPGGDAAVTAIVSVDASAPPGTTAVAVPAPSAALLRVPARPAPHGAPRRAPRVLSPPRQ